MKENIKK